jgi:hypothetical protein
MKARFWLLCVCLFSVNAIALDESDAGKPLDPAYEDTHGMLLFTNGSSLYASYFPSYRKPRNAQLIYKIDALDNAVIHLVRDAEQVTMKTERINLQRLIRGEQIKIKADVYLGHFDRGGSLTYQQAELNFIEQKYLRMLEELGNPKPMQIYDQINLGRGVRLLVHQIQGAPSFDHIVLLYNHVNCLIQFDTGSIVPQEMRLLSRLSFCGPMKPIYYEAGEFAEGGGQ